MNLLKHIFELLLQLLILCTLVEFTDKMPACFQNLRTKAQRSITKVLISEENKLVQALRKGFKCAITSKPPGSQEETHHTPGMISEVISAGVHHPVIGIT